VVVGIFECLLREDLIGELLVHVLSGFVSWPLSSEDADYKQCPIVGVLGRRRQKRYQRASNIDSGH
jgi:hypothetical protein